MPFLALPISMLLSCISPPVPSPSQLPTPPSSAAEQGRSRVALFPFDGAPFEWRTIGGERSMRTLPSELSKDTVLGPEGGPYLVDDALVVLPGVKLVLQPGTVIRFTELGLIIRGELVVNGTPEKPVLFRGAGPSPWKGIFIDRSKAKAAFSFCEISGATYGIRALDTFLALKSCRLEGNAWAVVSEGGIVEIERSLIKGSGKVGVSVKGGTLRVTDSKISDNASGGVLLESSHARIERNAISENGQYELKVLGERNQVQASNNWWGKRERDRIKIVGPVEMGPILSEPLDLMVQTKEKD